MKNVKFVCASNPFYFIGLLLVLTAGLSVLLLFGKAASFLFLNSYHSVWLNIFFINYTFVGDGIFALLIIGLYYFFVRKSRDALALLYAFVLSGIGAQVIKNIFHTPRPKLFFPQGQYSLFIDHVTLSGNTSFPSGHTATAFAIATVFIILLKDKRWQLPILIAAVFVAYSRIYLGQHFLVDVLAGALVGTITAFPASYLAVKSSKVKLTFKNLHGFKTADRFTATGNV